MMMEYISVDPGPVHCGVAVWVFKPSGWLCTDATDLSPEECVDLVHSQGIGLVGIACEGFWLKPGKMALQQAGSSFGMVEVIGTLRNLARWRDIPFEVVVNVDTKATRRRLGAAGYEWVAHDRRTCDTKSSCSRDHAHDAEAVGIKSLKLSIRDLVSV